MWQHFGCPAKAWRGFSHKEGSWWQLECGHLKIPGELHQGQPFLSNISTQTYPHSSLCSIFLNAARYTIAPALQALCENALLLHQLCALLQNLQMQNRTAFDLSISDCTTKIYDCAAVPCLSISVKRKHLRDDAWQCENTCILHPLSARDSLFTSHHSYACVSHAHAKRRRRLYLLP